MSDVKPGNRTTKLLIVVGLIVVTIISLGFVAYTSLNPQATTLTQQQFQTSTQNQYLTETVTSLSTTTSVSTVTASAYGVNTVAGYPGPGNYNCGYYGCSPPSLGAYGSLCQSTGQNSTVSCSGYLSEPGNGCVQLAIPYTNPYLLEATAYQFYTLRNLPSNIPPTGSWVTVTGQLGQGYSPGSNGAACSAAFINVSKISP